MVRSWQRSSQNPLAVTGCLREGRGRVALGWGRGEAGERQRRQRSLESLPVPAAAVHLPPLACLSAGPRGTDPGRERAWEGRLDFPFAAGQGGEVLELSRLQLHPEARGPALRGRLAVQWGEGELSCWLEPAEVERTLRPRSHCSRPPGPLQEPVLGTDVPCHLPVLGAPDGVPGLHEVESVGVA